MNIRLKILVNFSVLTISLLGLSFILIYTLFANYRREEFQQRIKDHTFTTLKFMVEVKQIDHDLLQTMDKYTINSLFKEKILIFDSNKKLIYASLDDTKIEFPNNILNKLDHKHPLIEISQGKYEVVAVFFEFEKRKYYAISKAVDQFGHSNMEYLQYIMIAIFLLISSVILISSFLLSNQISHPINQMRLELLKINLNSENKYITVPEGKDEINLLATRFNELMKRLNEAFSFQKHAINHISHELKTPIAILVSNFEKMEKETDIEVLKAGLKNQKEDTKNLSDIINALLEISKVEAGNQLVENVRIDELIFDVVDEIRILNENFQFELRIDEHIESEQGLIIAGNSKLLRLAIMNLVMNCIQYSSNERAIIVVYNQSNHLIIEFINVGPTISEEERQYIFQHFFRGKNSKGKRGFGLGLVLINKILMLYKGETTYDTIDNSANIFRIKLPLS